MSDAGGRRTGIVLLLDEHAPEVATARYELDPAARARIGLHVTVLFPWIPLDELTESEVEHLRALVGGWPRPAFELVSVEVFADAVAYAAPEPSGPLLALIRELAAAYPAFPPYGNEFALDTIVPHATLAAADLVERARARVEPLLPVRCEPAHASLIEEFEPNRFREREALPFGAPG